MLNPNFVHTHKRASKAAVVAAVESLLKLMTNNIPENGAYATAEIDDRYGPTFCVRYTGKPTKFHPIRGGSTGGLWTLEKNTENWPLPATVRVGQSDE
jgi:hypothetical protein